MTEEYKTITKDEVDNWGLTRVLIEYLTEILIGNYPLDKARKDILSLRNTKYDKRNK